MGVRPLLQGSRQEVAETYTKRVLQATSVTTAPTSPLLPIYFQTMRPQVFQSSLEIAEILHLYIGCQRRDGNNKNRFRM